MNHHIIGSINIPLERIESDIEKLLLDKNKMLVIYCQSGIRSIVACDIIERKGYQNVYNLKNGFENGG